jgi:hypothetical protein
MKKMKILVSSGKPFVIYGRPYQPTVNMIDEYCPQGFVVDEEKLAHCEWFSHNELGVRTNSHLINTYINRCYIDDHDLTFQDTISFPILAKELAEKQQLTLGEIKERSEILREWYSFICDKVALLLAIYKRGYLQRSDISKEYNIDERLIINSENLKLVDVEDVHIFFNDRCESLFSRCEWKQFRELHCLQ